MSKTSYIVGGLGFGDEGKGRLVDYLVRRFGLDKVVRYNGGPQAAHHVVTPEGLQHCCAQVGAGSLVPGVKTYLSRHMLVNPLQLETEIEVLSAKGINDMWERIFIDENCFIVTPFHRLMNQIRELLRGANRHGSCGKGVGEAAIDVATYGNSLMLQMKDLTDPDWLWQKLTAIKQQKIALAKELTKVIGPTLEVRLRIQELYNYDLDLLIENYIYLGRFFHILSYQQFQKEIALGNAVFEGAQGMLLHRDLGFVPHVTQSDTSFTNAENLLAEAEFSGEVKRLAVIRGYYTRHGAGPFVTEDAAMSQYVAGCHNESNKWQGEFRLGWFDLLMARYALEHLGAVDGIAITNLDRMTDCPAIKVAMAYQHYEDPAVSPLVRGWGLVQGLRPSKSAPVQSVPHALSRCRPVYKSDPSWRITDESGFKPNSPYLKFLAEQLKVPVVATAFGPTATDTICLWN